MGKIDLNNLNPSQRLAVETIEGPVQLCSTAGSGKTRVLTYRIAHMIQNCGIDPQNIFVGTFSKKAAIEMKERLETLISKQEIKELTMGTFHGIGYRILKDEYTISQNPMRDFELLQGPAVKWFVRQIMDDLKIQVTDSYNENLFVHEIAKLKREIISPEQYMINLFVTPSEHVQNVARVYEAYEARKEQKHLIDFDDMLYRLYFMFFENPKILAKYQSLYKYILVDEAQDNNKAQYELIKMLGAPDYNVFIVGDDDQSIYKFRGAEPQQFISFKDDYQDVKIVNLQDNYRSLPHILDAANKLIKNNKVRMPKELVPFRKAEKVEKVQYVRVDDENKEAEFIANDITEQENSGRSLNDMIILYRTNAQARAIEDELVSNAIPYIVFNGISFYERAEVKDLVAYLKLALDTNDNESFKRIINKPNRFLGAKFIEQVESISKRRKISYFDALDYVDVYPRIRTNVEIFQNVINIIRREISQMKVNFKNVGNILETVRINSDYDVWLKKENGDEEDNVKLENINALGQTATRFKSVTEFVKYVDLVANARKDDSIPTVKLMTIHKAKGLEYPMVYMAGMVEGVLPHSRALDDVTGDSVEEERRLAYVALTRAQDRALITSPRSYMGKDKNQSRFINEAELEEFIPEIDEEIATEVED